MEAGKERHAMNLIAAESDLKVNDQYTHMPTGDIHTILGLAIRAPETVVVIHHRKGGPALLEVTDLGDFHAVYLPYKG